MIFQQFLFWMMNLSSKFLSAKQIKKILVKTKSSLGGDINMKILIINYEDKKNHQIVYNKHIQSLVYSTLQSIRNPIKNHKFDLN